MPCERSAPPPSSRTRSGGSTRSSSRSGVVLGVRIGIETGEVVAGVGTQGTTLVTGDTVNVAARLEGAAAPGEILLGAGTLDMVRDAAVVEPLEPLALKGKSEPVPAFRLVSVAAVVGGRSAGRGDAPMVGRERELGVLRQAFERAVVRSDRPALHRRSARPASARAAWSPSSGPGSGDEAAIHRGRCLPYGEGITYWPIMRDRPGAARASTTPTASKLARERLDRLVGDGPEARLVAQRVAQLVGLDPSAAPQEELFWACRKLLESLAGNDRSSSSSRTSTGPSRRCSISSSTSPTSPGTRRSCSSARPGRRCSRRARRGVAVG